MKIINCFDIIILSSIARKGGKPKLSTIKFLALGGLGENGKNMYVVEVDERIFVLDAGLKYPSVELYGIDAVIPDITYLIENKDRVQGIFISHGHEDHIGALPQLLKVLDVGVFGTHFTISLIEDLLTEEGLNVSDYRLYRINEDKVLKFGNITVEFYNTTHSLPESIGVAIKTSDGAVVYVPDFTFSINNDRKYRTSFNKLAEIAKGGTLALLSESLGVNNTNRVHNDIPLFHKITEVLLNSGRVIFSLFSTDLDRIQKVINISASLNRRIAIVGRKAQRVINIAMNSDYLKIPQDRLVNLKFIDDENKNDFDDLVVIVTGVRHEPFYMLQRMCQGQDRLIEITDKDNIIIMTPAVPGTERMAARTIDILTRHNAKVTIVKKDILVSSHADSEDLKMLYSILNPKYIIPVVGEYRHQFMQKKIAMNFGYSEDNVILLDNGEMIIFKDGVLQPTRTKVQSGDVLVDGSLIGDINEVVLKDREMLAAEGVVMLVVNIDARIKKVVAGPKLVTRGFAYGEYEQELTESIYQVSDEIIDNHLSRKYIDWNELKNELRDAINKEIYRITKKTPIIIPTVIDTQTTNVNRR